MQYNTTPLPRILNGKDPITGKVLVLFSKRQKRYKPNPNIPVCRSGEEHLVENYDIAKKDNFKGWVLHHRLELTLDGDFANSAMDLVNKDMYFHRPYFELIWMKNEEHTSLHLSGDKCPMHGRTRDRCPNWKGGIASDHAEYLRQRRAKKHVKYMRQRRAKKRALRDCALLLRSN